MGEIHIGILLASVIAGAAPILLATLGETITEKSGIINLSLDGSILLSAMAGFVIALKTGSAIAGFLVGSAVGGLVAATVAFFSIYLRQSQVAVGFVLTLMARDLAYFIGSPYSRVQGPQVGPQPVPLLESIPFLGEILFRHSIPVYLSLILIALSWWYIYRTPHGLCLRSVGEHPEASYARGINPKRVQMLYAVCGGLLVGLAGATFSLCIKPGWGQPQGAEGTGWIALALVIFGGWNPLKAALGAYLFSFLQVMSIYFQGWMPSIPAQVFQVAPFPLMIFILAIISFAQRESVLRWSEDRPIIRALLTTLTGAAPSALGRQYKTE
ncbi:MAG: ABC transporter permease [Desulfomonilia bacterium]